MIEKCILDQDPRIEIEPEDFSEEADSTILVRERVRGTKLEGAFKTVNGQIVGESTHTVTIQSYQRPANKQCTQKEMWQQV